MPITSRQAEIISLINDTVATLNDCVHNAAKEGISTEFLLTNVNDDNSYHQKVKAVLSERL